MTGARRGVGRAAATVTLALAAGSAQAQAPDDGPVVITPEAELEWLRFTDWQAALELEWRTVYNETESGGDDQRTVENRMREIVDLRTEGYAGHPNLLELDLGVRFWPEQRWIEVTGEPDEFSPQFLVDWDVSGLFLKESDLPFTLYTRQNTSTIDRQFGTSLENTFSEYGFRAGLRSAWAPTSIHVFRREIDQTNVTMNESFDIDQFTVQADGRVDLSLDNRLAWDAKYDIVDESGDLRAPRSFDRFEGTMTHSFDFGPDGSNLLRTQLRVVNRTRSLPYTLVRLLPRLRLRHSPDLSSWYDYRFELNDREGEQEQIINNASANFQYQVFDSLTMVGNAGVNRLDISTDDFNSTELFTGLDIQYIKQVPYGTLEAGLNGIVSYADQSDLGTPIQVTDQLEVFSPISFTIDQRNVQASSIVLTDVTGTITYTLNVDYVVFEFPDQVQVQLIPGGDIVPNQAVLVDYVIGPEPGGTTISTGIGVDVRYTFREGPLTGLGFYGNLFRQDENRSEITSDFPENDFTDLRYGIEYNFWKIYARAERQHRDSTLSPFDALRLEGRYTEPLGRNSNLVIGALYQELDRTEENFRQTTTTFSAQWNQRITRDLHTSLLVQYQLSDDNVSFDSEAIEGQFDVTWRYRQTEVYAQLRGSINNSSSNDTTFARILVGLRREF